MLYPDSRDCCSCCSESSENECTWSRTILDQLEYTQTTTSDNFIPYDFITDSDKYTTHDVYGTPLEDEDQRFPLFTYSRKSESPNVPTYFMENYNVITKIKEDGLKMNGEAISLVKPSSFRLPFYCDVQKRKKICPGECGVLYMKYEVIKEVVRDMALVEIID